MAEHRTAIQKQLRKNEEEQRNIEAGIIASNITPSEIERKFIRDIMQKISSRFSDELVREDADQISDEITALVQTECAKLNLSYEEQKRVERVILLTVLGNGPIEPYMQDPEVTEIVVQRYDKIVIERNGKIEAVDTTFADEEHLVTIIKRIVQRVNRTINMSKPIVDARLKDGSRINATVYPVSVDGATLTIRKFNKNFLSPEEYVRCGSISQQMLYFLAFCVYGRQNIFVSGGTGTGKTTLLNMLSSFIPRDELIITIEESCELQLQQPNVRRMETRPATTSEMMDVDQAELVRSALRQRPDRIILGETRDGSIVDIVSAMSTGHEGSMTTVHANSPENLCDVRIPILYSMNKESAFSEESIILQMAEAINVIVQIERFPDGSRKITRIVYVDGIKNTEFGKRINLVDLFRYDKESHYFYWTGLIPNKIVESARFYGYEMDVSRLYNEE